MRMLGFTCCLALLISVAHSQTNMGRPPVIVPLPGGRGSTLAESLSDLKTAMDDLQNMRNLKRISLQASANNTAAAHKVLDDEILALARQQEALRSQVVKHLEGLSGVKGLNQGPLGTSPGSGRGILGDIDTRTLSVEEFYDVLRSVERGGMTIKPIDGNAVTIEGANITIHREPPKFTQNGVEVSFPGYGKETAIGMGKGNPHIDVLDNVKKSYGTLNPQTLESEQALQELGKMTTRNMQSGGIADDALQRQAEMLKQGYSPEAAGIVRDNATAAQRMEDMRNFQNRCREVTTEALTKTQAASELKVNQMLDRLQKVETELAAAKSAAQSANTVANTQSLEAEINALRRELVVQQRGICDATKALLAHNPEAAALLSSTVGKVERVVVEGQVMFRAANGTLYTEKQLGELILAPQQAKLAEGMGLKSAAGTALKGVGWGLNILFAGLSGWEGAKQAVFEEGVGDSFFWTWAKGTAYGTWNMAMGPVITDSADKAVKDAYATWGNHHSMAFLHASAMGFFYVGKALTWDVAKLGWDWGTGELAATAADEQVTLDGVEDAQEASTKISKMTKNLQDLAKQVNNLNDGARQMGSWFDQTCPFLDNLCSLIELRNAAIQTCMTEIPKLHQQAGDCKPSKSMIQSFNDEFGGLAGDYKVLTKEIGETQAAFLKKTITPARTKANYNRFKKTLKAYDERYKKTMTRLSQISCLAVAGRLYSQALQYQGELKELTPEIKTAGLLFPKQKDRFAVVSEKLTKTAADHDTVRKRLLDGITAMAKKLPSNHQLLHVYLMRLQSINAFPIATPAAQTVQTAATQFAQLAGRITATSSLTPPEVKGYDDLKQIAPLAKTVLEAIMGAERRAAEAKEKTHEALANLEALLKDQPDIETKLVLTAPDKGQEGESITIIATLENPPDKFTIQLSGDGEHWAGPEDNEDIKLTGNRVTITTSLDKPGYFTLHARAIEPAGKEVLAEAKKEIAVEPKNPMLILPPKDLPRLPAPSPDEELKAALEEYKAAQAAYNAARKQSQPPKNIAEIADRQQKAYRRYNDLILRRSQSP